MKQDIFNSKFWADRLTDVGTGEDRLYQAIYKCPLATWRAIEEKHRRILSKLIQPDDSILDAGCGWGRLLTLLPREWDGVYLGVDLSPDFINLAKERYNQRHSSEYRPSAEFVVADLRKISHLVVCNDKYEISGGKMTWAILISIRPMIIRNAGAKVWEQIEEGLRKVADKLLFLEYDSNDNGSVE